MNTLWQATTQKHAARVKTSRSAYNHLIPSPSHPSRRNVQDDSDMGSPPPSSGGKPGRKKVPRTASDGRFPPLTAFRCLLCTESKVRTCVRLRIPALLLAEPRLTALRRPGETRTGLHSGSSDYESSRGSVLACIRCMVTLIDTSTADSGPRSSGGNPVRRLRQCHERDEDDSQR